MDSSWRCGVSWGVEQVSVWGHVGERKKKARLKYLSIYYKNQKQRGFFSFDNSFFRI